MHILSLVTDNNPSKISGTEENGQDQSPRKYGTRFKSKLDTHKPAVRHVTDCATSSGRLIWYSQRTAPIFISCPKTQLAGGELPVSLKREIWTIQLVCLKLVFLVWIFKCCSYFLKVHILVKWIRVSCISVP